MRPFGKPWSARAFSLFTVLRQADARSDPGFPVWAKRIQRRFKKEEKPCCIDRYNLPPERISAGGESSLCPWRQQGLSRLLFRYWPALLLWRAKANNPFGQKEPSASNASLGSFFYNRFLNRAVREKRLAVFLTAANNKIHLPQSEGGEEHVRTG